MSESMDNPVLSALKKYEQNPARNEKKAVLLMPQGGYFLYGNRFCSMAEYELEFYSETLKIQGKSVPEPLFFSILSGDFHVTGAAPCFPKLVSLIFQISFGTDEPLRGILLALEGEAKLSLFSDASTEALYRLSRRCNPRPDKIIPPDEELCQYAETLRRNDLHSLTELYLRGQTLKELLVDVRA